MKVGESFCRPATQLVYGACESCSGGRARRMEKCHLLQAAQAVELFRNRIWIGVSCIVMQRALLLPTQSSCLFKKTKKRHSTRKRSPNYVTASALLTDIRAMWVALFSKILHLTSENYIYFMGHKRGISFDCQPWAHSSLPPSHSPTRRLAVNDLSYSNLHIPVT